MQEQLAFGADMSAAIATLSSNGQVTILAAVRKQLGLKTGDKLVCQTSTSMAHPRVW
jgi:AbrB family looped-hinge helix DNA binding protein